VEKEAEEEEVVFRRGMEWNAGRSILREWVGIGVTLLFRR
jgi:hypothetical protein